MRKLYVQESLPPGYGSGISGYGSGGFAASHDGSGFHRVLSRKSTRTPGRKEHHQAEAEARQLVARLLGTDPANIALLPSASDALSLLALSIDWKAGDP